MISLATANAIIVGSLVLSLLVYVRLSRYEGTYVNVLTPGFIIDVPANYLLPLAYISWYGIEASTYACVYVFATMTLQKFVFVQAYTRTGNGLIRLPFRWSYCNFAFLSLACLGAAVAVYAPLLLQFRDYLLDPRQIYIQTRTGFGPQFYTSSILAYLAIILILFAKRHWLIKAFVILAATGILFLHGSKGQVLSVVLLLLLFLVYVKRTKFTFTVTLITCCSVAAAVLVLFSLTMYLGESPREAIETISRYSDDTRNAMLVIDSDFPVQYGRLTIEANTLTFVPRALVPNKPKNFGPFYLDEQFYPELMDRDEGAPRFGIGVQYADFGAFAIVYLTFFSALKGWLARLFVNRVKLTNHPADFFVVSFLADVGLFPIGAGWLFPEAILVALFIRYVSRIGTHSAHTRILRLSRVP